MTAEHILEGGPDARTGRVAGWLRQFQQTLCRDLEAEEVSCKFRFDPWVRKEGGGGVVAVLEGGEVFEKAGVGFSEVFGPLGEGATRVLGVPPQRFHATGVSLILHPRNPHVPLVHANYRYFELEQGMAWFGGGSDLTPCYPFEEDFRHFHTTLKRVCDGFDKAWYPRFKQWADEYFFLPHRQEHRGIGGIFFDRLAGDWETNFSFVRASASQFAGSYVPIVTRRKHLPYGEGERAWQLHRRGRYVEFNLLYDRGTLFGLQSGGNVESILMSLPPSVRWAYQVVPAKGSPEEAMLHILRTPRTWAT